MRNMMITVLLLAASGLLAGQMEDLITESYDFEAIERYDAAIKSMTKLVELDDDNAFYLLRLGWLYYASGQYAAAERYYALSAEVDPSLESLEGRMNSAYAQQKWSDALSAADDVLKRFPNHFYALATKGYAYYTRGDYEQSVNFYRKALTIYPYNLEAMGYLLSAEMRSGDRQAGAETLQRLAPLSPNNPFVLEYEK